MVSLGRRLVAEFGGCLFLAAAVVGSGIAAQTLSPHVLVRPAESAWPAGIDPPSALGFIVAQLVGGGLGFLLVRILSGKSATSIVLP